ncbi:PGF-pre-PGF domain-containing protein [Nanoarchaeota archaeon]
MNRLFDIVHIVTIMIILVALATVTASALTDVTIISPEMDRIIEGTIELVAETDTTAESLTFVFINQLGDEVERRQVNMPTTLFRENFDTSILEPGNYNLIAIAEMGDIKKTDVVLNISFGEKTAIPLKPENDPYAFAIRAVGNPPRVSFGFTALLRGNMKKFDLNRKGLAVKKISFMPRKDNFAQMYMELDRLNLPPNDIPKLPYTYEYFQIEFQRVSSSIIDFGAIEFAVDKNWMNSRNINDEDMVLYVYKDKWIELPAKIDFSDRYKVLYSADVPSFSVFAIAKKGYGEVPVVEEQVVVEPPVVEQPPVIEPVPEADENIAIPELTQIVQSRIDWATIFAIVVALIVIIALLYYTTPSKD